MSSKFDDRLVKKAYKKVQYTKGQIDELRHCMHPDTGPMYFLKHYMWIQHPTRGRIQFAPYEFQEGLVDAYHNYRKSINMVSRQMGKSTVAAGYLLWYAMFVPDSTIVVASNKHAGALEIMQRVRFAYESIPDHIRSGVLSYNKQSLEFDNGSRIIAQTTTSNTGRGMSISLIYLDELAFVEPGIAKEMWTSLSPTLSTGGKCIITSTPDTDEDQFAELWFTANKLTDEFGNEVTEGPNGFKPFFADWKEHPDRDEAWANGELNALGEDKFMREHECKFISFEETLIAAGKLAQLEGIQPISKTGQVRWYGKVDRNCTYIAALDPAMGTGGDNAAIQVYELPSLMQVAEWQNNKTPIERQVAILREITHEIYEQGQPEIYWSVENNTLGEAALVVIRDTGEEHFAGTMLHDPERTAGSGGRRKGFTTTNRSKLEACSRLKNLVESKKMKITSKSLISELKTFVSRGNTFEARIGQTDDLVMATVLCLRMMKFVSTWDENSYEVLNTSVYGGDADDNDAPMPIFI